MKLWDNNTIVIWYFQHVSITIALNLYVAMSAIIVTTILKTLGIYSRELEKNKNKSDTVYNFPFNFYEYKLVLLVVRTLLLSD